MGFSVYAENVCYIVIGRDHVNLECQPPLSPEQSVGDWVRAQFPGYHVINGVDEDMQIFDKNNKKIRKALDSKRNLSMVTEPDTPEHDWAAIILSNLNVESYKGRKSQESDTFNVFKFAKLFANPEDHLVVVTEVEASMSE